MSSICQHLSESSESEEGEGSKSDEGARFTGFFEEVVDLDANWGKEEWKKRADANGKMLIEKARSLEKEQAECEQAQEERDSWKKKKVLASEADRDYWNIKFLELQQELQSLKRAHGVEETGEVKKATQT